MSPGGGSRRNRATAIGVLASLGLAAVAATAGVAVLDGGGTRAGLGPGRVAMTLTRTSAGIPRDHLSFRAPPLERSTRQGAVTRLLDLIPSLPAASGAQACPLDLGVAYRLTFSAYGGGALAFALDPGGCELLRGLPRGRVRWILGGRGFWTSLSRALGHPGWGHPAFAGRLPNG